MILHYLSRLLIDAGIVFLLFLTFVTYYNIGLFILIVIGDLTRKTNHRKSTKWTEFVYGIFWPVVLVIGLVFFLLVVVFAIIGLTIFILSEIVIRLIGLDRNHHNAPIYPYALFNGKTLESFRDWLSTL